MYDKYIRHHGIVVHIVDRKVLERLCELRGYDLDQWIVNARITPIAKDRYMTTTLTLGDMVRFVLGNAVEFDYAIPRSVWSHFNDGRHVWLYDNDSAFGKAYNAQECFFAELKKMI